MTSSMPNGARVVVASIALMTICITSIACGAARRREPLGVVPALDSRAARGQVVFMINCHQCHPGGEAGLGPALNDKPFPEFLKKFQVRHGLGAMPSFSEAEIPQEDLDALMEYLSALRRSRSAPAPVKSPS